MKVIVSQEEVIEAVKAFYKLPDSCDVELAFTASLEDEPVKQVKTRTRRTKLQILEDQQAQLQEQLQEQLEEAETEIETEIEAELQVITEDDFLATLDELNDDPSKHQTGSKTDVDNELDSLFN